MPRRSRLLIDHLSRFIHPTTRFWWGLALLSCLVFAQGWPVRLGLMLMSLALAVASGKRVSLPYFGFLIATVVFFHLLLPIGRVWWTWGPLTVTEGAFFLGLGKGCTFAGLVFVSLASVSRQLQLPGRFGRLWAQTFSWYEQLMDQRQALKPRALLLSIDRLLEGLYPTRAGGAASFGSSASPLTPTRGAGWALIVVTTLVALSGSVFGR